MRYTSCAAIVAAICCLVTIVRPAAAQCTRDTDCKGDRICVSDTCRKPQPAPSRPPVTTPAGCSKDTDCKGNRVCVSGGCREPQPAPSRPLVTTPAGCSKDTDCKGIRVCASGTCTAPSPGVSLAPATVLARQERPAAPWRKPGFFALTLGFGGSGGTGDFGDVTDPLVGLRVTALLRVHKYFSLGIHGSSLFLDVDDADVSVGIFVAPEGRLVIPVLGEAELWTGLAVGYMHQHSEGEGWSERLYGAGLGWGFGGHYFLTRRFALGASFWLYAPFFSKLCQEQLGWSDCVDVDVDNPAKDFGLYWMVGAHATVYFGK